MKSKHHCGIYIVVLVALLHIGWAIDMTILPKNLNATPIHPYHVLFGSIYNVAAVLYGVSALSIFAEIIWPENLRRWLCLVPQQVLTMLSAFSSYTAISESRYADLVIRNAHFIFRDQWGNIVAMLVHTVYMLALLAAAIRNFSLRDL